MDLQKSELTGEYIANAAFYAVLEEAWKSQKWPANFTYNDIVSVWVSRK
jgi:hypothetical protein